MEKGLGKKRRRRRKCRHCGQLYDPDARNRGASALLFAATLPQSEQGRKSTTLAAEEGQPRLLWEGTKIPDGCSNGARPIRATGSVTVVNKELRYKISGVAQVPLMVGLIAHLTNSTLQEQIATTTQALVVKGQDILGRDLAEQGRIQSAYDDKKSVVSSTAASGSGAVQLD